MNEKKKLVQEINDMLQGATAEDLRIVWHTMKSISERWKNDRPGNLPRVHQPTAGGNQ